MMFLLSCMLYVFVLGSVPYELGFCFSIPDCNVNQPQRSMFWNATAKKKEIKHKILGIWLLLTSSKSSWSSQKQ